MSPRLGNITSKMLGDAGEHYALSQLTFAGKPASKMPDGWAGYDLAVESGRGLVRVSVKTRKETTNWKNGSWFMFDERLECEWLVFVFVPTSGQVRSWIIPFETARHYGNVPAPGRKDPHIRDVSFSKLNKEPLSCFENNWILEHDPSNV